LLDALLLRGYCPLCDVRFDASTRERVRQHTDRHWRWMLASAVWWHRYVLGGRVRAGVDVET
jgi:hypothetical protein